MPLIVSTAALLRPVGIAARGFQAALAGSVNSRTNRVAIRGRYTLTILTFGDLISCFSLVIFPNVHRNRRLACIYCCVNGTARGERSSGGNRESSLLIRVR